MSGGDPLSLSNSKLGALLAGLHSIPRPLRLRIHTRNAVVLPTRIDQGLLTVLAPWRDRLVIVVHVNHAQELDAAAERALRDLREHCHSLLNQSVLLAGVNDSVPALAQLSQRLFECQVLPYYLHLLDRVAGAAHFDVAATHALELLKELAGQLPGYLLPKLVREEPGATSKTAVVSGSFHDQL